MGSFRGFAIAAVIALCCVTVNSFSVNSPRKIGKFGQEEVGPIDNFTCPDDGLFPYEDCLYYVNCWDNRAVLYICTDEMLYDLRYNGCEYAENVDCGDRLRPPDYPGTRTPPTSSTTVDPTAPTSPPSNETFDCPDNGAFPHETKCELYWNCWEGIAYPMKCQGDYLFDLVYDGCNFPDQVDCGTRERPSPTPSPSTTTVSTTASETDAPTTTTTTTAPPSSSSQQPTEESSTPSSSAPTTTRQPGGFECPTPEGRFPDPEDCAGFYDCENNHPTHGLCPEGFHFNPRLNACDWPEEAGCETR